MSLVDSDSSFTVKLLGLHIPAMLTSSGFCLQLPQCSKRHFRIQGWRSQLSQPPRRWLTSAYNSHNAPGHTSREDVRAYITGGAVIGDRVLRVRQPLPTVPTMLQATLPDCEGWSVYIAEASTSSGLGLQLLPCPRQHFQPLRSSTWGFLHLSIYHWPTAPTVLQRTALVPRTLQTPEASAPAPPVAVPPALSPAAHRGMSGLSPSHVLLRLHASVQSRLPLSDRPS